MVDTNIYKTYFITCKKFIKNYDKDICKNIKFLTENKKSRLDENMLNIKQIYMKIFNCIKLFDINTDKNINMNLLVKTILKADTTYFDEIRNNLGLSRHYYFRNEYDESKKKFEYVKSLNFGQQGNGIQQLLKLSLKYI
jgi:hypothetical protein